jgi:hypothetical protein
MTINICTHLIYKNKHGVYVSVCVSHDVLHFNIMVEPMIVKNPITKKKISIGGHERRKTKRGRLEGGARWVHYAPGSH